MPAGKVTYISGDDLAAAAAAAKKADVAIVFAYQWESEGMDLKTLDLSDDQNKLIEAVAAANPKTIVVLETGSPATMPWIDKVAGVVEAWYPGIRGAEALANILTGEVNPTGKLAITFPKSDADLPHPTLVLPPPESQPSVPRRAPTSPTSWPDGQGPAAPSRPLTMKSSRLATNGMTPRRKTRLFPFGFGLSYTTYAYSGLTVDKTSTASRSPSPSRTPVAVPALKSPRFTRHFLTPPASRPSASSAGPGSSSAPAKPKPSPSPSSRIT